MQCGRRWRQSLLGSSRGGEGAVGEAAQCSKVDSSYTLVLPLLYWFCCWSDPLLSLLVHLRLFSYCYWDKSVLGEGQQIPEFKWVSCGNTYPKHPGRESGETLPCSSKLLDYIKLLHVISPSVFCGSGLGPCPVFLPACCLPATS